MLSPPVSKCLHYIVTFCSSCTLQCKSRKPCKIQSEHSDWSGFPEFSKNHMNVPRNRLLNEFRISCDYSPFTLARYFNRICTNWFGLTVWMRLKSYCGFICCFLVLCPFRLVDSQRSLNGFMATRMGGRKVNLWKIFIIMFMQNATSGYGMSMVRRENGQGCYDVEVKLC